MPDASAPTKEPPTVMVAATVRPAVEADHSLAPLLVAAPELPVEARARAQRWLAAAG